MNERGDHDCQISDGSFVCRICASRWPRPTPTGDPIHPEGIYQCEGCGTMYPEYVNGCVVCWDDELTSDENRAKYPHRSVRLVVPEWT